MTFRQLSNIAYEDGHGAIYTLVVVSDDYNEIQSEVYFNTDILNLENLSIELENENAALVTDELSFSVNEAVIQTTDDQNLVNLLKSAVDPSNRIFIEVYFDSTPDVNNRVFTGVVSPEVSSNDIIHKNRTQYNTDPQEVQEVSFKAAPFFENTLDNYSTETLSTGLSEAWISENVKDRQGYFHNKHAIWIENEQIKLLACDLVNLNSLLREFADDIENDMQINQGIAGFKISFNKCKLNGVYYPLRPAIWKVVGIPTGFSGGDGMEPFTMNTVFGENTPVNYTGYPDDYKSLYIDPEGKPLNYSVDTLGIPQNVETETYYKESLFIDFKQVKNRYTDLEPIYEQSKKLLFSERVETFTDLLYSIAQNFGLYLRFYFVSSNHIQIEFINAGNYTTGNTIYKDALDVSTDYEPITEKFEFRAYSSYLAYNSVWSYKCDNTQDYPKYDTITLNNHNVLLSMSKTFKEIQKGSLYNEELHRWNSQFPRTRMRLINNHTFADKNGSELDIKYQSRSVTTAFYTFVDKYDANNVNEPDKYFTSIAGMSVNIGGEDKFYGRLDQFLNDRRNFKINRQIRASKEVLIPSWNSFKNSPVSDESWKNVQIGNTVTFGAVNYTIIGIDRSLQTPETKLKLIAETAFNFITDPLSINDLEVHGIIKSGDSSDNYENIVEKNYKNILYITGSGKAGNAIALVNGEYVKALPIAAHAGKLFGIALEDWTGGNFVNVQKLGDLDVYTLPELYPNWASITIGNFLFLRDDVSGHNITGVPLTAKTAQEDMYAIVGRKVSEDFFNIDFGIQGVLE